ncbi:AhpD-like protein [Phakopsora pachyrhizi]|nr:AhpD-like protein [Phakopsora pachyrhizi]
MPRIPIIYPKPGESDVADKIRQRRNPQGLIELDGVLLNNPRIAHGWNELFGTIRTENSLPGDLREALILRVAALNTAAYEWIQHEKVGRSEGLSTAQLLMIRDSVKPIRRDFKTSRSPLSSLHEAGLAFADAMTRELNVNDEILKKLKSELLPFENGFGIDRMILDATATVAGYNMVSRVLFTLFVADDHQKSVPIPGLETKVIKMAMADGSQIHVQTQFCPGPIESRPWLVFCNALLTNLNMWGLVTPSLAAKYNLVCFDQRGHGQVEQRIFQTTIPGF